MNIAWAITRTCDNRFDIFCVNTVLPQKVHSFVNLLLPMPLMLGQLLRSDLKAKWHIRALSVSVSKLAPQRLFLGQSPCRNPTHRLLAGHPHERSARSAFSGIGASPIVLSGSSGGPFMSRLFFRQQHQKSLLQLH